MQTGKQGENWTLICIFCGVVHSPYFIPIKDNNTKGKKWTYHKSFQYRDKNSQVAIREHISNSTAYTFAVVYVREINSALEAKTALKNEETRKHSRENINLSVERNASSRAAYASTIIFSASFSPCKTTSSLSCIGRRKILVNFWTI